MKVTFEPENFIHTSPATVSRGGLIYVSVTVLGWEPLLPSWIFLQWEKDVRDKSPAFQEKFNDENKVGKLDPVLLEYALEHLIRILRYMCQVLLLPKKQRPKSKSYLPPYPFFVLYVSDTATAEKTKTEVQIVADMAGNKATVIGDEKTDFEKHLFTVKPVLDVAEFALDSIWVSDIKDLNELAQTPEVIKVIFDTVLILK